MPLLMKYCEHCNVSIAAPRKNCPLCQGSLVGDSSNAKPEEEAFPIILTYYKQFNLFFRILIFVSIALGGISLFLNVILLDNAWWSLAVVAGIIYMWLTVITSVKKRNNVYKNILYQIVFVGIVVVVLDHFTGWGKWSVNYVIPALCTSGMLAIAVLAKIRRIQINEYAVYMLIDGIFALVPLVFWLTGIANVAWPSLSCVIVCILLIAGFWLFSGLNVKSELNRRFHL